MKTDKMLLKLMIFLLLQVPETSGNYNLIDTVVPSVSSPGDLFTDFNDFKSSASQNGVMTDIASSKHYCYYYYITKLFLQALVIQCHYYT